MIRKKYTAICKTENTEEDIEVSGGAEYILLGTANSPAKALQDAEAVACYPDNDPRNILIAEVIAYHGWETDDTEHAFISINPPSKEHLHKWELQSEWDRQAAITNAKGQDDPPDPPECENLRTWIHIKPPQWKGHIYYFKQTRLDEKRDLELVKQKYVEDKLEESDDFKEYKETLQKLIPIKI